MFDRIVYKTLPDGRMARLYPFHVCLKGLSDVILCRDDEDFDVFVKNIHLCALRKNVLVVVYIVMSNHLHVVILAQDQVSADNYALELKRINSMFFTFKYGLNKTLKKVDFSALFLDNNSYLRNSIVYTLKNSLDAGCRVDLYSWSAYRCIFPSPEEKPTELWPVSRLSTREVERIFHTNMDISLTGWKIDNNERLDPASVCDTAYAESAFNGDISYFSRLLGTVDAQAMTAKFVDGPRTRLNDQEFFKVLSETSERWYNKTVDDLSMDNKLRLAPYIYHVVRTSPKQIARGLGLDVTLVEKLVLPKRRSSEMDQK